jgi:transposase
MKIKMHIGLDVHKEKVVVATAETHGEDPSHYGKWGGTNLAVELGLNKLRKKYEVDKKEIRICYEAGPTGFTLVRRLTQLGYDCIVIAPSNIEQTPGRKIKTDKRDAIKLARLLRAGDLKGINIPEPHDEAIRDLCRARTDASDCVKRAKQRLGAFLLRNGIRYDQGKNWSQGHMNHLRKLMLNDPSQQVVLEEYLIMIDTAEVSKERLADRMKEHLEKWDFEPHVRALMCFRGYDYIAAMTVISEIGDLTRFPHPSQLMGYLGAVPSEATSDTKRRQGAITKSGNGHARWMLVECAAHYRHGPKVGQNLSKRQEGQSREVRAIAWRAQNRLHHRYKSLMARGKNRNKVIVALARETLGFIWELYRQVEIEQGRAVPEAKKKTTRKVRSYELKMGTEKNYDPTQAEKNECGASAIKPERRGVNI